MMYQRIMIALELWVE